MTESKTEQDTEHDYGKVLEMDVETLQIGSYSEFSSKQRVSEEMEDFHDAHVNQHSRRLLRRDSDSDSLDSYNRFRNEARDSLANDIGKKDAVPGSKVASHITGHRVHMDDSDSNLERMSGV